MNSTWAYDFGFDTSANGQQLMRLAVVDGYTRDALAIEVLAKLSSEHGAPKYRQPPTAKAVLVVLHSLLS